LVYKFGNVNPLLVLSPTNAIIKEYLVGENTNKGKNETFLSILKK